MVKSSILASFDEDPIDFNVDAFITQLFNTIDGIRSQMSLLEGVVFEHPTLNNGKNGSESRINAFYRLLGLPACRSDISPNENTSFAALSQQKTLNYFTTISSETVNRVANRERILHEKLDFQRSVNIITDPIAFSDAKDGTARRPSIFPLVVHAAIPVFPINRRTAPLFYNGDLILFGDQKRLTRPFIEHVIYMRTKVYSGFDTSSDALKAQIESELKSSGIQSELLKDAIRKSADDAGKSEFLSLRIINRLLQALKQCAKGYRNVINNLEKLRSEVQFVPAFKSNPNERAGNLPDSIVYDPVLKLQVDNISDKLLEMQIDALEEKIKQEDVFMKLLPSEFIKKSDKLRRIQDEVVNPTLLDDAFLSEFYYLVTYQRDEYVKQLKQLQDRKANFIAQYEQTRRDIIQLNGEGSGLSIFDVLCVILALFTVDLSSLLALINPDSLDNLRKSDLYYKVNAGATDPKQTIAVFADIGQDIEAAKAKGVESALQDLENKVRENFSIAESFYKKALETGDNAS